VPVDVTKYNYLILTELLEKVLRVVNGRMQELGWLVPASIEVDPQGVASVVPSNHSVRIKHRDNLEDELLSEELGLFGLSQDEIDEALNQKRGITLSWVNTAGEIYYMLGVFALPT
jgi:hypothetical protein